MSTSTGDFSSLAAHMEWADALMWKAVMAADAVVGDDRVVELLHHLHVVQWVYLQMWRGEPLNVPDRGGFGNAAAVRDWARPFYPQAHEFVGRLSAADLSRTVTMPWADEVVKRLGSAAPATLGETILQVVMHTTYHRGQVARRVRELGGEPPLTDFIAWIWTNRPKPAW